MTNVDFTDSWKTFDGEIKLNQSEKEWKETFENELKKKLEAAPKSSVPPSEEDWNELRRILINKGNGVLQQTLNPNP